MKYINSAVFSNNNPPSPFNNETKITFPTGFLIDLALLSIKAEFWVKILYVQGTLRSTVKKENTL